ncbi:HD-GYP domain-containing protein [Vibrio sp.]|uniref:HD-GYP domain-containing protein n=1 Tax=Vibrio sp. TaxID=678 RepID=UPI003D132668
MQFDPKQSIKIAINDLMVGMFVTAIEDSQRVNLANAGRVGSLNAIQKLADSGIKYAWVDQKLSAQACVFRPAVEPLEQAEPKEVIREVLSDVHLAAKPERSHLMFGVAKGQKTSDTRQAQQRKASKVIQEAKALVQKLLTQIVELQQFEGNEADSWAEELVELALVDTDALNCVSALRDKDSYLLAHSVNVACLLVKFGTYLDFSQQMLKELAVGGLIHDVGKIKVEDKVLHKPGKLTQEEFEHIKLHQVFARDIIRDAKELSRVSRDVCLMHHEKLDGKGYPNGLKGEQIPLHGRMSGIVDIYDALTSDRCYKQGMSPAEAFKILLSLTPFHLDRELVYKFINCIGVYPVGSVVELCDGRVGIVWSSNQSEPLKPTIKCFYSNKHLKFTDVSLVDLTRSQLTIEKAIAPNQLPVDITRFYEAE